MSKVLGRVMGGVSLIYILVGVFGYLTFADRHEQLIDDNRGGIILLADYKGSIPVTIVRILIKNYYKQFNLFFSFSKRL